MTAAFYDEVMTVAPARTLTVVRDTDTFPAPVAEARRRADNPPFGGRRATPAPRGRLRAEVVLRLGDPLECARICGSS
jgi:hypothetical protein